MAPSFRSTPGMGVFLEVKVLCGGRQCQPLANGKGVHREAESEGSRRQSPGPRNTNRVRPIAFGRVCYAR